MRRRVIVVALLILVSLILVGNSGLAANQVTIATVAAYSGEQNVRVDIYCHNEDDLFEYFNLIVFDDTRLEFVSVEADRGVLWYGYYPTHVDGDHIYVHGVAGNWGDCLDPDLGYPGSPLYHLTFEVKGGQDVGFAPIIFASEPVWDGHWNDCSGYQIVPNPDYFDGGVNVLGPAAHITIGTGETSPGDQAVVDIYLHNDLDVFEYFNRILFTSGVAAVDSIVAARGSLWYGYYPTQVSGDTIYVHGWADADVCFPPDHSYPGAELYRLYFTVHEWIPPGYVMPLTFLGGDPVWNHWVGCDLTTTDAFTATDGSVTVLEPSAAESPHEESERIQLTLGGANPAGGEVRIRFRLAEAGLAIVGIYDLRGRRIRSLSGETRGAGWHSLSWDGRDDTGQRLASGTYLCRLQVEGEFRQGKVLLVR